MPLTASVGQAVRENDMPIELTMMQIWERRFRDLRLANLRERPRRRRVR